ncbi:hypothetical protein G9F72_008685 [Clostridium estertheticum]|uniref:hypothetical protein n=1 Tax=Clostridium estertheticum TaxID=238834 RepID=UPI0013E90B17|nr:hypothetical protein [Clostridium estertheticum]MBZ9686404.1 hypothetical protein [Clostridium estertheticum]
MDNRIQQEYCYFHIKVVMRCECGGATIRKVRVIGTVAEDSLYDAVVNIAVKRASSGHTDNYYVVDEYNNLLSGIPLYIDRIYNMAIIPKETTGDVETANFYGSYKV